MRGRIALIRHGESTWVAEGRFQGRQDPPLSALGQREVALLAQRLADPRRAALWPLPADPPVGIWHSPLGRARATAEAVGGALDGVTLHPSHAFIELGQGEWEGRTHADVAAAYAERLAAWRAAPLTAQAPGGESLREASSRVRSGLAEVQEAVAGGDATASGDPPWAAIVAHDGILRLALLILVEVPLERFWSVPFPVAGVSVVELGDGRASLLAHGLSDHLAPLRDARGSGPVDRKGAF